MITPVNGHLIIEPVKQSGFVASSKEVYDEIGVVVEYDKAIEKELKGARVYFDSWLAAKFPKGDSGEFFWLVKWEDVRAIEYAE